MPLVEPTVVIGHEEEQELLQNTGIPAVGWVVGLRHKGTKLRADLSQIFPDIAKLIEAGAFKHVSAEIYPKDRPPEGVPAKGCMLRRVALLGGQLPHIKSLADLPPAGPAGVIRDVEIFQEGYWQGEWYGPADLDDMVHNFERFSRPSRRFAEYLLLRTPRLGRLHPTRRVWQNTSRTWACFSEVRQMADTALRDAAVGAIKASHPDLSDDFLASLSDEQLAMLAAPTETPPEEGGTQMQDMPSREQMIADLVALGEDRAALEAMTDEDLMRLWQEKKGTAMSDTTATTATRTLTPEEEESQRQRQRQPTKVTTTQQFSEQRLTALERRLAVAEREQRRQDRLNRLKEAQTKKALIKSFCEVLKGSGKASAADVEFDAKTGEPVGAIAYALSVANGVRKFGEDTKSDLEVLMEKLEQRPARRFGELIPDPLKQTSTFSEKVEKHYEGRLARANGRASRN
jgi:hypothetical protein